MNEVLRQLLNLPEQASTYAREVDSLHYFVIAVTMLGAMGVLGAALLLTIRYRRGAGAIRPTPKIVGGLPLEGIVIVGILVLFLGIWVIGFRQYVRIEEAPPGTLDVYVVAKQWMWKFTYPEGPASAGVLYVPVHRAVKLIMTSRDVIHSFYVPAFRMKQDAVPGRYTTAWFEADQVGRFPIRCAEYCGTRHAEMLGDVVVLNERDYEQWLAEPDRAVAGGVASHGEQVAAELGCLRCHTLDGTPHIGPTWTGLFGRTEHFVDGSSSVVDEAYLTESMMDPGLHVVAGFHPVMPSYQGQIDPGQTAAIVELIKSLRTRSMPPNPLPLSPP